MTMEPWSWIVPKLTKESWDRFSPLCLLNPIPYGADPGHNLLSCSMAACCGLFHSAFSLPLVQRKRMKRRHGKDGLSLQDTFVQLSSVYNDRHT